jgi:hypothetical protein
VSWGSTEWIRSNASRKHIREEMFAGDLILAWQVDRAEAVGLCRVAAVRERDGWHDMFLEPVEQFDEPVRIRHLRREDSTLWQVRAFRPGSQGTIFPTTPAEGRLLLRTCRQSGYRVIGRSGRRATAAKGAGFGEYEQNRKTEQAAIKSVSAWLRKNGWTVGSVERDNLGYDLEAERADEVAHEVKGVGGSRLAFPITANEVRQAAEDPSFWLCVVTEVLNTRKRRLHWWTGDQLARFELRAISYVAAPSRCRTKAGPQ